MIEVSIITAMACLIIGFFVGVIVWTYIQYLEYRASSPMSTMTIPPQDGYPELELSHVGKTVSIYPANRMEIAEGEEIVDEQDSPSFHSK